MLTEHDLRMHKMLLEDAIFLVYFTYYIYIARTR